MTDGGISTYLEINPKWKLYQESSKTNDFITNEKLRNTIALTHFLRIHIIKKVEPFLLL